MLTLCSSDMGAEQGPDQDLTAMALACQPFWVYVLKLSLCQG